MGRRSTKSSPATGAALPFDTVGMTILPGRALPVWAEPADEAAELSGPELIADAPEAAVAAPSSHAPVDAQAPPQDWAAVAVPQQATADQAAMSPEPAFAMAGAAMVGPTAAAGPAAYGPSDHAYPPEPSRYPAAPAAGLAAMTAAPTTAPAQPGFGSTAAPAYGQGRPAPSTSAEHPGAGGVATATAYAPETGTRPLAEPAGAHAADQITQMAAPAPEAPSTGWKSPERPELSPEHVALLSWWADMIAAGQFPAPAGAPGTEVSAAAKKSRRSFPLKAVALSLVAVAAVGTAAVVGPKVMAANEPPVVPATELSMPANVGALVAITDPAIGTQLETLLGFGLRPAGVTVTGAYGTAADSPLALAAMATTMGAPAEAVGQIATWADRTGATVAPSVAGVGANEGITCAAVEAIPDAQPGSFCVWAASGKRGQTYSVAMSVEDAQTLTNQLRTTVTGA